MRSTLLLLLLIFRGGKFPNLPYTRTAVFLLLLPALVRAAEPKAVVIGSKKFTESVILAEMAAFLVNEAGLETKHRVQLGSTQIVWNALLSGEIDIYPEYTGTLLSDIVKGRKLEDVLAEKDLRISRSLGFANSYALGMLASEAKKRNIKTVSDLKKHADLRYGFSEEFRNRSDGWKPLKQHYGLTVPDDKVRVLDHDLAMRALHDGQLDVADVYTTEGAMKTFDLVALEDDRKFFPGYDAVWVYRADLPREALEAILRLEGKISEREMAGLNAQATERGSEKRLAAEFLRKYLNLEISEASARAESSFLYVLRLTGEHMRLVGVALLAAVLIAIPLGVFAARHPVVGQVILTGTGTLQTIPSLALLVLLTPFLGLGVWPAIVAIFLYSLLPIVRNTHAGLCGIAPGVRESAEVLGLPPGAVLRLIELPLASRSILAGIKTAAVISVGNATLGALIGAGGFGEAILTGIRIGDRSLILMGAVPAAALALLVQGLFELAERVLTPRGLRL